MLILPKKFHEKLISDPFFISKNKKNEFYFLDDNPVLFKKLIKEKTIFVFFQNKNINKIILEKNFFETNKNFFEKHTEDYINFVLTNNKNTSNETFNYLLHSFFSILVGTLFWWIAKKVLEKRLQNYQLMQFFILLGLFLFPVIFVSIYHYKAFSFLLDKERKDFINKINNSLGNNYFQKMLLINKNYKKNYFSTKKKQTIVIEK